MKISSDFLPLKRIEALSDGIFAIAMTILVLNIGIPDREMVKQIGLHKALLNQSSEFYSYFLSFYILGIFWYIQHKQMSHLIRTNTRHIWMTIFLLMFICLIPFSASLQSDYGEEIFASTIFSANMTIIGLIFLGIWRVATKNHKLVSEDFNKENIRKGSINILIFISISLIALALGFFIPSYSGMAYLLIPVAKAFNK
jgi:uncharacterized membrane protein